jgi:hypothetical protein
MCRIDRIVQNLIIFPDFILHILSINVNRISDDPLIISIFQKEICHSPGETEDGQVGRAQGRQS